MVSSLNFLRQSSLIPSGIGDVSVTVIGAGAIGSHVVETLCKTGVQHITVWDDDTVEAHNLPNQGYYLPELGNLKVDALKTRMLTGTGVELWTKPEKYLGGDFETTVVISAVDNMATRKEIFKNFLADKIAKTFIDGRMGARIGIVYLVDKARPDSISNYAQSLHNDGEGLQEACTAKATIFCAYGLSGFICGMLIGWALDESPPVEVTVDYVNMAAFRQG